MTLDQIDRMVRGANPVPDLKALEPVDASLLELDTRRTEMETEDRIKVDRGPEKPKPGLVIGIAAAAVVIVGALLLLGTREDAPVADQPTTSTAQQASATEIASEFVEAWGSFDADRAITYLTDEAITGFGGSTLRTPSAFRLQVSLLEAIDYQESVQGCEQIGASDSGDEIRCGFDFHALGSDEIGLGPYEDNYWDLTVRDGMIVQAAWTWDYRVNRFSRQMWEPFQEWIRETHRNDFGRMYLPDGTDWQLSDQSIELWERYTREYVEYVKAAESE